MKAEEIAKYAYEQTYFPTKTLIIYNGLEVVGHFGNNTPMSDVNMIDNKWEFIHTPKKEKIILDGKNVSFIDFVDTSKLEN